jgi:hypothetical protein
VYCYMDDLAQWSKRVWHGKTTPPAKIDG